MLPGWTNEHHGCTVRTIKMKVLAALTHFESNDVRLDGPYSYA